MTGRPSSYTDELAETLCRRIAEGESVRTICRDEAMPSRSTIYVWLDANADFAASYARAMAIRMDGLVEEIEEIADDGSNDWMQTEKGPVFDAENVQRSKLRVSTRQWMAERLAPKKYGSKVAVTGGGEGDAPIRHAHDIDASFLAVAAALGGHAARPARGAGDDGGVEGGGKA